MVSHVHRLNDHEPKAPETIAELAEILRPISELAKAILDERNAKESHKVEWHDHEPPKAA